VAARSRRLVTEGLEETQRAVRVLRDEPIDVADQVAALAEEEKVDVRIVGDCRPLPPATGLALVRVAQEAVTNARKHAVGAQISVTLVFDPASASVDVENNRTTASALSSTGTGYGLQGLRERLELVGGRLLSGWDGDTWKVHADVPT